jgi:N-acyl-D-amino-acid deacylase
VKTTPIGNGRNPPDLAVPRSRRQGLFFKDRGRLRPGLRADVNIIDFDGLRLHQPEVVHDLPAGGRRLVQRVDGYRATFVAGTPVFENGEDTGVRPGRLVRADR